MTSMTETVYLDDHMRTQICTLLAGIPGLLRDLEVTLTREHRLGGGAGGPVGRTRGGPRLPYHLGASAAIDHIEVVLRVYCARVGRGRATPEEPAGRARWLAQKVKGVPGDDPGVEGLADAVIAAVNEGFSVVDRPEDTVYLGLCGCAAPLYAVPDQKWVVCWCGQQVSVLERRGQMLEQARYRFGTAAELAKLLPWFGGIPISASAISKAGERGKLARITVEGSVLYRVGDVVDWHAARYGAGSLGGRADG